MESSPAPAAASEEKFSLPRFLLTVGASLAGLVVLLRLAAPEAIWHTQRTAGLWHFAAAFLAIHLLNAFIEYIFHRYVLHKPVVPFLSRFYKQHTLHHSLTRIGKRYTAAGREVPFVENIYPVTEPEQGEASFFPWYTLAVFAGIVTPLLALLQWLAPAFPWFFAGYGALAFSLALYEIFHAIEHWAFERWAPLIEHRQLGWFWRKVYSFHLRHHAVIDCNEAISGFFTLPVFDWIFGTFILPQSLYLDGSEWQAEEFVSPRPCALVRWCDARTDALVKNRRQRVRVESAAAAETIRPSLGERLAHYLTHGVGLAASLAALVLLVDFAAVRGDALHVAAAAVFGASLVLLYAMFVSFRHERSIAAPARFRNRQHVAIFLLIAGTATPFLIGAMRGAWGWSLFGVVWGLCLVGALARLLFTGRLKQLSTFAYLLIGLLPFVAVKPLAAALPHGALWLLAAGVLSYFCGTLFHLWQQVRYRQVIRHAFALGGTVCHLLAVLLFVLPARS
ncbi:MAG TPA: hemolysin III family protein [Opitutaceae bacterium]|nr:hemolysin III family protein [Opitutaceae bacterium]